MMEVFKKIDSINIIIKELKLMEEFIKKYKIANRVLKRNRINDIRTIETRPSSY